MIHFFDRKKEYRSLSNFWEGEVEVQGRRYASGEHCFHGEKFMRISELVEDEKRKQVLREYGASFSDNHLTAREVKKRGGKGGLTLSDHELFLWERESPKVQWEICTYKFQHYEEVRKDLIRSGNNILIHPALRCNEEKTRSKIWEGKGIVHTDGRIEVIGGNKLGNIWMALRDT
jgi:ribA/ribD-fused uncharacterized protein